MSSGATVSFDFLVVCPGIQLDWDTIPGMATALDAPGASSNYRFDLTTKTWDMIRQLKSGTAVFTCPPGPSNAVAHHRRSRTLRQIIGGSNESAIAILSVCGIPRAASLLPVGARRLCLRFSRCFPLQIFINSACVPRVFRRDACRRKVSPVIQPK